MSQNPYDDEARPEGEQPHPDNTPRYEAPHYQAPADSAAGAAGDQQPGQGSSEGYAAPAYGSQQQAPYGQDGYDSPQRSGSSAADAAPGQSQPSYGGTGQGQSPYSSYDAGAQGAYGQSPYSQPAYGQPDGQAGQGTAPSYGQAPGYGQAPAYESGQPSYDSSAQAAPYGAQQAGVPQYGGAQSPQYQPQAGGQWSGAAAPGAPAGALSGLKRLRTLLFVSAGLYLLLAIAQIIGRTTMAYARSLQEASEMFGLDMGGATSGGLAFGVGNIISWVVTLALYALVLFLLTRAPGPARIIGIILAILGSLGALFAFISAFTYGWAAILVVLVGLAFIAVNVLWIIQAIKAKPAAR